MTTQYINFSGFVSQEISNDTRVDQRFYQTDSNVFFSFGTPFINYATGYFGDQDGYVTLDFDSTYFAPNGGYVPLDFYHELENTIVAQNFGAETRYGAHSISHLTFVVQMQGFLASRISVPEFDRGRYIRFDINSNGLFSSIVPPFQRIYTQQFVFFNKDRVPVYTPSSNTAVNYADGYFSPYGGNVVIDFEGEPYSPPYAIGLELIFGAPYPQEYTGLTAGISDGYGTPFMRNQYERVTNLSAGTLTQYGTGFISNRNRAFEMNGFVNQSRYGTAEIYNAASAFYFSGISSQEFGATLIDYRTKTVRFNGINSAAYGTHDFSNYYRWVNMVGDSFSSIGNHNAQWRQYVFLYTLPPTSAVGFHTVVRNLEIRAESISPPQIANNHFVGYRTKEIDFLTMSLGVPPPPIGITGLLYNRNRVVTVSNGIAPDPVAPVTITNQNRYVFIGPYLSPFGTLEDPAQYGNRAEIYNANRTVFMYGLNQSWVSFYSEINNKARPINFEGEVFTNYGDTHVTHYIQYRQILGFDSLRADTRAEIYNEDPDIRFQGADYLRIGSAIIFNSIQYLEMDNGPEQSIVSTDGYIDYAVRYLNAFAISKTSDAIGEVWISNAVRSISMQGFEATKLSGIVELFERFNRASFNALDSARYGTPTFTNENKEIHFDAMYPTNIFGTANIQNYIRSVSFAGDLFTNIPVTHHIRERTSYIFMGATYAPPTITGIAFVHRTGAEPPGEQRALMLGIGPYHDPINNPIVVDKIYLYNQPAVFNGINFAVYGSFTIRNNTIFMSRWVWEKDAIGAFTVLAAITQSVHFTGVPSSVQIPTPRFSPFHIYLPLGDQKPAGYNPIQGGALVDNGEYPKFGTFSISNYYRTIYPRWWPSGNNPEDPTSYGNFSIENKDKRVVFEGRRFTRYGIFSFWGVSQTIIQESIDSFVGTQIPDTHVVKRAFVSSPLYIQAPGIAATQFGNATNIELKNREIEIPSVAGAGTYGNSWISFRRRFVTVTSGIASGSVGNNKIEFKNRELAIGGYLATLLPGSENYAPISIADFNLRMRVLRGATTGGATQNISMSGTPAAVYGTPAISVVGPQTIFARSANDCGRAGEFGAFYVQ